MHGHMNVKKMLGECTATCGSECPHSIIKRIYESWALSIYVTSV